MRMEGSAGELRVVIDEPTLVFEGHLNRAFSIIDNESCVGRGLPVAELRDEAS